MNEKVASVEKTKKNLGFLGKISWDLKTYFYFYLYFSTV